MSGYHFFLISGYLDILDTDFFWMLGLVDTWISRIIGYMDTWINGYLFSLDTWILGYFGYQIFSLSTFWISYPSIRIFLDTFFKRKKGNQIQELWFFGLWIRGFTWRLISLHYFLVYWSGIQSIFYVVFLMISWGLVILLQYTSHWSSK